MLGRKMSRARPKPDETEETPKGVNGIQPKAQVAATEYEQLPRSALIRLLQEHDTALLDAGTRANQTQRASAHSKRR
jgi:hypothetical protein